MVTAPVQKPIARMLDAFPLASETPNSAGWYHHEDNPRFDFRENEDGTVTLHPWTHHTVEDILAGVGLSKSDLYHGKQPSVFTHPTLDVVSLAHARRIHWKFLYGLGLADNYNYRGRHVVKVPYHLPDGTEHTKMKVRKAIEGQYKHSWDEGTPGETMPYGLDKLHMAYEQGYLLIGEGESDGWACWYHGVPYLGLPGATQARKLAKYGADLSRIQRIYILHEPDQVEKLNIEGIGFYKDVHNTLRGLGYKGEIFCIHFKNLTGCKDPGDLHISTWNKDEAAFKTRIHQALDGAIPAGNDDLCDYTPDDAGNGDAMYSLVGQDFLWCGARGWFIYTGTHWKLDADGSEVRKRAVETLRKRRHAAVDAEKEAIVKCTVADDRRVNGCVNRFKTLVSTSIDEFDSSPDQLNCKNGVLDLRTGTIEPHTCYQRFTYCLPVEYGEADYSAWLTYLNGVIGGGQEVIDYMQMALGYSFTGHTQEEILFYLFGPTRSGKGTFAETIMSLLPTPISKMVDFNSFTAKREGDVSNFDLAPLKPSRMIFASESNRSQSLNPAKIKQLTGGDHITCCYKHKDFFEYRPQFKVWMMSNHPVNGDPDDDALWGRVRVIEFPNSFLGIEDKELKTNLKKTEALKGVLYWIVQGAMAWYALGAKGLTTPEAIANTTQAHRDELDYVQQWLDEVGNDDEESWTPNALVTKSYLQWCKDNNVQYPKGPKALAQSLKVKGYQISQQRKVDGVNKKGVGGLHIFSDYGNG